MSCWDSCWQFPHLHGGNPPSETCTAWICGLHQSRYSPCRFLRPHLINKIPEIKKAFKVTDVQGFPRTESIYSEPIFISWSEEIKAELRKLKQDELIKEIIELFGKFTGWTDKKLFNILESKLRIVKENYDDYIIVESKQEAEIPATVFPQSVTNIYFQGNMSGSNIATGNNSEQEYNAAPSENKSWFEKYWFPLLLALIGAAGTIVAAIIAL